MTGLTFTLLCQLTVVLFPVIIHAVNNAIYNKCKCNNTTSNKSKSKDEITCHNVTIRRNWTFYKKSKDIICILKLNIIYTIIDAYHNNLQCLEKPITIIINLSQGVSPLVFQSSRESPLFV